jgi:hypothetical protein
MIIFYNLFGLFNEIKYLISCQAFKANPKTQLEASG